MIPLLDSPGPRRRFPFVMLGILAVNLLVFGYELSLPSQSALQALFAQAGVIPVEIVGGASPVAPPPLNSVWLTLVTSMFLHGGFLHIGSNMLYLFIFGDNVEDRYGHRGFLLFYLVCGIAAGLTESFVNSRSSTPSIGASGAIAGVLAAYLVMFPGAPVRTLLFVGPFPLFPRISAVIVIGFWFITQFASGVLSLGASTNQTDGVAVWAHIGGFVCGLALTLVLRPRPVNLSYRPL